MTKITPKWIHDNITNVDQAGRNKDGSLTLRREFYWGFAKGEIWAQGICNQLRNFGVVFEALETGSELKPFRGGGTVKQNSHYWMKIRILN